MKGNMNNSKQGRTDMPNKGAMSGKGGGHTKRDASVANAGSGGGTKKLRSGQVSRSYGSMGKYK